MTFVNMTCQLDGKIKIEKTILALIDFCVRHPIESNDDHRLIKKRLQIKISKRQDLLKNAIKTIIKKVMGEGVTNIYFKFILEI